MNLSHFQNKWLIYIRRNRKKFMQSIYTSQKSQNCFKNGSFNIFCKCSNIFVNRSIKIETKTNTMKEP